MKKLVRASATAVTAAFLLTGCTLFGSMGGGATPTVEPTSSSTASSTSTADSTATAEPTDNAEHGGKFSVAYACRLADSRTFTEAPSDLKEIWALGDDVLRCTGTSNGGNQFSATEQDALDTLGQASTDDDEDVAPDDQRLADLYGLCATPGFYFAITPGISTDEQASQIEAALLLCPEHPDVNQAKTSLKTYTANVKAGNDGTRFKDGVWKVGEDIKAGTYKPEAPGENCRWFRYDSSGKWIESSYDKAQVDIVVTIDPTDATFESRNCGYWRAS